MATGETPSRTVGERVFMKRSGTFEMSFQQSDEHPAEPCRKCPREDVQPPTTDQEIEPNDDSDHTEQVAITQMCDGRESLQRLFIHVCVQREYELLIEQRDLLPYSDLVGEFHKD